jgi:hypothetical protein
VKTAFVIRDKKEWKLLFEVEREIQGDDFSRHWKLHVNSE